MGFLVLGIAVKSINMANRRCIRSEIRMWVGIVQVLVLLSCFPEKTVSFNPGLVQLSRTDMVSPDMYVNVTWCCG